MATRCRGLGLMHHDAHMIIKWHSTSGTARRIWEITFTRKMYLFIFFILCTNLQHEWDTTKEFDSASCSNVIWNFALCPFYAATHHLPPSNTDLPYREACVRAIRQVAKPGTNDQPLWRHGSCVSIPDKKNMVPWYRWRHKNVFVSARELVYSIWLGSSNEKNLLREV